MKKTLRFEIVTGIQGGYKKLNNTLANHEKIVSCLWQDNAETLYKKNNIYISAVIKCSYTVYNQEWGCPRGGERTVVITGVANKEFVNNLEAWKEAVLVLAKKLKEQLNQRTMTCEFMETELHYLK
ncbi:hypothetical protein SAMN04487886_11132 [Clostridium sp. DSM 8431]|uniref:hypothetical protein n=1 Tax=Clostridium sp. DSM 8431 TaxID=1761781 RepID=UPI0008EC722F|nr:hypothetical protein [Clostridium sp. DSM 8431]SFU71048.1 hypothetical protein SAMN04487886_11132 [Clostridium sp. DSM 8431]